ncbi:MAG: PHP domain-containing protein [Deltaproteobacteria bacterium]|nr:PHP domain-containing protein [Deltaproteobacteria bacterium]
MVFKASTVFKDILTTLSGCIDLHIHSTASDGSLSPVEIILAAKKAGLKAIAITDHDTVAGTLEALACPDAPPLEVMSGVEISARFSGGALHLLGYLFRADALALRDALAVLQKARVERNLKITERLRRLGIDVQYDEVCDIAGGGQVGRPHFALVLVRKGVVHDIDQAFDRFLKSGRPAYVPKSRLSAAEAIAAISAAGGVPVLAHPGSLNAAGDAELSAIVSELKGLGLKGIEAYYPGHDPERIAAYEQLAVRYGLVMTGGTDFHGVLKPDIRLGVGRGDLRIPYHLVKALKACASGGEGNP